MVSVYQVKTKKDLKRFIKFPWKIYKDNSVWVPPLIIDRMEFLNKAKNPFFHHSEADLFLAEKNGNLVGRIAAIKYNKHLETFNDKIGFFGFFEAINDQDVSAALFNQVSQWLNHRGLTSMRGPTNFTMHNEAGLLVNGFEESQVVMHTYNPPYYPLLIEAYGFQKIQDLYAYRLFAPEDIPDRLERAMKIVQKKHDVVIRSLNMKYFDTEVDSIFVIINEAWEQNWGAVYLTRDELGHIVKDLKFIIDPDLVILAEVDGKVVGMSVTLPDINQAIKYANGRLFPIGLLKILWHRRHIDALRVFVMGVLKEYRTRGLDAAMYYKTMNTALKKGYKWGDMSWILESNLPMRRVLERVGAEIYKTYRIYEKKIG